MVIKEMLYHYKWRLGQKTGSQAIKANAWDHRADALSALAVLVGLALVRFGGDAWRDADEVAALVVVVLILWLVQRLPVEGRIKQIIQIVVIIIGIIALLKYLAVF